MAALAKSMSASSGIVTSTPAGARPVGERIFIAACAAGSTCSAWGRSRWRRWCGRASSRRGTAPGAGAKGRARKRAGGLGCREAGSATDRLARWMAAWALRSIATTSFVAAAGAGAGRLASPPPPTPGAVGAAAAVSPAGDAVATGGGAGAAAA